MVNSWEFMHSVHVWPGTKASALLYYRGTCIVDIITNLCI